VPADSEPKELLAALNASMSQQQYQTRKRDQRFTGSLGAMAVICVALVGWVLNAVAEESTQKEKMRSHETRMTHIELEQAGVKGMAQDIRNTQTRILTLLEGQQEKSAEIIGLIRRFHMQPPRSP